ncbi:RICIN domain-containing protein [Streptomyces sp. NPDC002668]|uniref:RICIN domain-containing protein n=1 Tax=Streptomyces sp. NPDC002668 TaxID=3154422 RepID=UPI00332559AD
MTIWTSLEPASANVDPGGTTTVRLRLRNIGDVVDEYRVVPVGAPALWAAVEPPVLRLYPGTTGTVNVTIAPPRSPDATAGPHPYGLQILPTEQSQAVTVVEGMVTVTPFTALRAELLPETCRGRFRGRPQLAIDNWGNVKLTASVSGSDTGEQLAFDIHPADVQIEPGRAAFLKTTIRPRRITWFGQKETRPFTLAVRRSGTEPLSVDGSYVQRSVLPRWVLTSVAIAMTLAIAFVALWFARQPRVVSLAQEQTAPAGVTELPTESAPLPEPSVPPSQAARPEGDKDAGGGAGGGSAPTQSAPSAPSGSSGGGAPAAPKGKAPAPKGSVLISQDSKRCIDVVGGQGKDGAPLQILDCTGNAPQRWDFRSDGTVRALGLCMDVAWGSRDDGAVVQLANCSGNPAQQFVLTQAGDLVNRQADKCVDVKDNNQRNGARLQLWTCAGTANQKWRAA